MKRNYSYKFAVNLVFFLDAFLSLLIITTSSFLVKTDFGRAALLYGFIMLVLTFVLRLLKKW